MGVFKADDGFQPMEMDLQAFDDDEYDEYFDEDVYDMTDPEDVTTTRRGHQRGQRRRSSIHRLFNCRNNNKRQRRLGMAIFILSMTLLLAIWLNHRTNNENANNDNKNNNSNKSNSATSTTTTMMPTTEPTASPVERINDDKTLPPTTTITSNDDNNDDSNNPNNNGDDNSNNNNNNSENTNTNNNNNNNNDDNVSPSSSSSSSTSSSTALLSPPMAFRDEDRKVYLGAPTDDWDRSVPRQATDSMYPLIDPPIAISDPYGWLRKQGEEEEQDNDEEDTTSTSLSSFDPKIIEYLQAENNYTQNAADASEHRKQLQDEIYKEFLLALQETYHTLPQQLPFHDGYYYYDRTIQNVPYTLHCRAPISSLITSTSTTSSTSTSGLILAQALKEWDGTKEMPILPGEMIWLDENELAEYYNNNDNDNDENEQSSSSSSSSSYFEVGDYDISPDGQWVAYTIDTTGSEVYQLIMEELGTKKVILWGGQHGTTVTTSSTMASLSFLTEISSTIIFGSTKETIFIVKQDEMTQRDSKVYQCTISVLEHGMMGSNTVDCELLFDESTNVEFWVSIQKSLDQQYLFIETASSDTTEVLYLDLTLTKEGEENEETLSTSLTPVAHRKPNVLYSVEHGNGVWWMLSNIKDSTEFELYYSFVGSHNWISIMQNNDNDDDNDEHASSPALILKGHSLEDVTVLNHHLIIEGRQLPEGIPQIWIATWEIKEQPQDEEAGDMNEKNQNQKVIITQIVPVLQPSSSNDNDDDDKEEEAIAHSIEFVGSGNGSYHASTIIVKYQSLVTPVQYIEIDLYATTFQIPLTKEQEELQEQEQVIQGASEEESAILIMERPVVGYDKALYKCQRILVPSLQDANIQIPVSLVYETSTMIRAEEAAAAAAAASSQQPTSGSGSVGVPIHLYAYGAYGVSIEDDFVATRLPIISRGVIYAIAHVRGGGELGRKWYNDGKLLHKKHTFEDFVDVIHYFVNIKQWTIPSKISCEGRSAGGLTIAASLNLLAAESAASSTSTNGDAYTTSTFTIGAAILGVPFVDVLATMSDARIPLTALEWLEWGNPNEEEYFEYMKSYSPTNNVVVNVINDDNDNQGNSNNNVNINNNRIYPDMLILAGLYDPRVAYWEPAKLTATLRHSLATMNNNNNNNPQQQSQQTSQSLQEPNIYLKTDMSSGHFSASDRYKYLQAKAFEYAFVLDVILK